MHVQMVTYDRGMMGEQEYIDLAHEIAPGVASVPGLQAAVWLDGSETGLYGALFFWDDHSNMERFMQSRFFEAAFAPFGELIIGHADVLENVTQLTQPSLQIVSPKTGRAGSLQGQAAGRKAVKGRKALTAKKSPTPKKAATGKKSATAKKPAAAGRAAAKKTPATKKTSAARKASGGSKRKSKTRG